MLITNTGRASRSDRNMPGGTDPARMTLPTRATDTARQTDVTANPISRTDNRPATVSTRRTTSWAGTDHGAGSARHRPDTACSRVLSSGVRNTRATITDQALESQLGPAEAEPSVVSQVRNAGWKSRVREAQIAVAQPKESEVGPAGGRSWELLTRSA